MADGSEYIAMTHAMGDRSFKAYNGSFDLKHTSKYALSAVPDVSRFACAPVWAILCEDWCM